MDNNGWLKTFLKKVKLNESTISMVLGAVVVFVVGALIFNYFRSVGKPTKEAPVPTSGKMELSEKEEGEIPEDLPTTHKVSKGEHLWAIAEKYYGSGYNWVDIAKENKLKNPNLLFVGQELSIPKAPVIKVAVAQTSTFGDAITTDKYTVVKGDHLWGIAIRAYGDGYKWVEIARANNLSNPNIIHPGNVLSLPR